MAHYIHNHLSFEKIKDLAREYFFILFSLQAPCALGLTGWDDLTENLDRGY
jgi:hypothetical protein